MLIYTNGEQININSKINFDLKNLMLNKNENIWVVIIQIFNALK